MAIDKKYLVECIAALPPATANQLQKELSRHFDKCGLFYRIFSRCKSASSTVKKLSEKEAKYQLEGKKMQDLLGVRVALYFKDDIDLCLSIVKANYDVLEIVQDPEERDTFRPMRLNIVCRMPEHIIRLFDTNLWKFPIDTTFEIQIRTIFSEGWHEVEHDLRYKHKSDWEPYPELSRNLNGIFATLETCDWTILSVLNELAYRKYKEKDWDAMLRTHLRIRLISSSISPKISEIFSSAPNLAKEFFRVDRAKLLLYLSNSNFPSAPLTLDNLIYITNILIIKNEDLLDITPNILKDRVEKYLLAN